MKENFGGLNTHSIVAMDGSDSWVLNTILDIIRMHTTSVNDEIKFRNLSEYQPTIKVVEFITDDFECDRIQRHVEGRFPGLCIFNPPMKV